MCSYILHTATTFETEIPPIENMEHRIVAYQENWPWLVYESGGVIAGYAYATKHRERTAYQWCAESSVYIAENFQGKGIANSLYTALFKILQFQGCRNVYAGITLPNDRSVSFHKKFGFKFMAEYKNIGYKLSRWRSVSWWELQLNAHSPGPDAPIKLPEVPISFLENTLTL